MDKTDKSYKKKQIDDDMQTRAKKISKKRMICV